METTAKTGQRRLVGMACACAVWHAPFDAALHAAGPAPFMMAATLEGQAVEGQPLWWNDRQMFLLGRDGRLHEFDPQMAAGAKKTQRQFIPYTSSEMRTRLHEEFGRAFAVSTTRHFVVVHPPGEWQAWADRLEALLRQFVHSMSVRGFDVQSPPTPLVAIVFRSQAEYYRFAAASGTPLQPGTLGHYDPTSNRIFLFDASGSGGQDQGAATAPTIVHEATHQTAYNVGVHQRFGVQPRWLVEGLAMMYEAPGVSYAGSGSGIADRINAERLDAFRRSHASRSPRWIGQLVASDRGFEGAALTSYAEAWTLSFYLCETQPQSYSRLLASAARRPRFSDYRPAERVADFTSQFGDDWELLASQVERWLEKLP